MWKKLKKSLLWCLLVLQSGSKKGNEKEMKMRVLTHTELDLMEDPPEHETSKEGGYAFAAGWYKEQVRRLKESNHAALNRIAELTKRI